jgi:hypothetical protein
MAFNLNRLRDFYLVMNKILTTPDSKSTTIKKDGVDTILEEKEKFLECIETNKA